MQLRWPDDYDMKDFADEWVALDGCRLIAHGVDLLRVLQESDAEGTAHPLISKIPDESVTYIF